MVNFLANNGRAIQFLGYKDPIVANAVTDTTFAWNGFFYTPTTTDVEMEIFRFSYARVTILGSSLCIYPYNYHRYFNLDGLQEGMWYSFTLTGNTSYALP
jgi:hypothetical protein